MKNDIRYIAYAIAAVVLAEILGVVATLAFIGWVIYKVVV